ncbi:MAG: penicillin acylase family protein [Bdellovibrionales bacterium]|nr:penicillin acylase family protein [Bdellovibrionales bacterium]
MSFSRKFVGLWVALVLMAPAAVASSGCETFEDANGVIHFRATDELETFRCFGWVHGRNRGWQMDFLRRTYQGRAAEIVGFSGVKTDFFMRIMNFQGRAEVIWQTLPEDFKVKWQAYADGVNLGFQALKASGNSYELKKTGQALDPWEPTHSVGMLLLQAFDQTRRGFEIEVEESRKQKNFPNFAPLNIEDHSVPWAATILKDGEYKKSQTAAVQSAVVTRPSAEVMAQVSDWMGRSENLGGSNNWVVSGARTKNGKPLLANDPHLSLKHPPFWHWVHPEFAPPASAKVAGWEAIGATLPGVPLVVSGANRSLAWGLTNSYLDAGELGSVSDSDIDPSRLVKIRPVVWFKWGFVKIPIFWKSFYRIRMEDGPTGLTEMPVLPIDEEKGRKLVLRWTGLELKGSDIQSFTSVMSSKNSAEVQKIFRQVGMPSFNFVFGDTSGGIGYQLVGRVFGKQSPPGPGIAQRTLQDLIQIPVLSPEDRPSVLNPKRGFVATANNRHWPKDALFHGGRGYSRPFRAHRIEELLQATPKHDVESFRKLQCDYQAQDARYLAPLIQESFAKSAFRDRVIRQGKVSDDRYQKFIALLAEWKTKGYQTDPSCRICAWYRRLSDRVGMKSGLIEASVYQIYTAKKEYLESFESVLADAFSEVAEDFDQDMKTLGREEFPLWAVYHRASFEHLGTQKLFPSGSMATPGDAQTVSPGSSEYRENENRYEHVWGASHRLIVELTQPVTVRVQLAGPNADTENKNLESQGSPWMKWNECSIQSQIFPMNWEKRPEMGQYQKLDWKSLAAHLGK